MKVLYLNHTSQISGAEQALLRLLAGLPAEVSPTVGCPEGPLAVAVRRLGVPVARVPGTDTSLKLHPLYTARGFFDVARATWSVRRLAAALGSDLIDANSIRAGLVASCATSAGGPPAVVRVHDSLPAGRLSSRVLEQIGKRAAVVTTNSSYTKASFTRVHPIDGVRVVYAPVDLRRFDPAQLDPAAARDRLGLDRLASVLAVVAQITPWKGQDDAIRTLALLRRRGLDVRLLLVGSPKFVSGATRYDNRAYARELGRLTESLGLGEAVRFLGEREDIPAVLRAVDVLLVPSWEEPFGLAIVEAMAMQVPVVATNVGGPVEIVRPGEDGLLLPPRAPETWAAAIEELIRRPALRAEMGIKAREQVAGRFGVERHVREVLSAYEQALLSRDR